MKLKFKLVGGKNELIFILFACLVFMRYMIRMAYPRKNIWDAS